MTDSPAQHGRSGYPQLASFVENRVKAFPGLKVAYKAGAAPTLVLRGAKGVKPHRTRVDRWKEDHIADFLRDKLTPAAPAPAAAAA